MLKTFPLLIILLFSFNILNTRPALAQATSIIDNGDTNYDTGNYGINDFTYTAIRIAQIILGVVGSLTLLMFTYGGLKFIISSGSPDKVKEARGIIIAAVVGLTIVFSSYLIIQFVMSSMGLNWNGKIAPLVKQTSK